MVTASDRDPLSPAEFTRVLYRLSYFDEHFPEDELTQVLDRPDEFIPPLLQMLGKFVNNPEAVLDLPGYGGYFTAMFLLAHFRETQALPLLLRLCLTATGETLDAVLGDFITEDLPAIFASVSGGEIEALRPLAEARDVDAFVRGAALGAARILLIEGVITREQLISWFSTLTEGLKSERNEELWSLFATECADLALHELFEPLAWAWQHNLIHDVFRDLNAMKRDLSQNPDHALQRLARQSWNHRIDDARPCMKRLAQWMRNAEREEAGFDDTLLPDLSEWRSTYAPVPLVRSSPKVGRNDPCPCGSGKKYKKCCGQT